MTIDWSDNNSNERLLAATHAALGKDAYSSRYGDIAHHFGEGATYNAIKNRYKKIAQNAEQMQRRHGLHHRPIITRRSEQFSPKLGARQRPARQRRSKSDRTSTLEPDSDDLEVIEQAVTRTPALGLRNASTRRPRIPVLVTPEWNSCSESNDISHAGDSGYQEEVDDDEMAVDAPDIFSSIHPPAPLSPSLDPISHSFSVQMTANTDKTLDGRLTLDEHLSLNERMARSSQELAKQRARDRQRYMDAPSLRASNETPTSCEQPHASASLPDQEDSSNGQVHAQSFVDTDTATCMLCMLRWERIEHARKHERESKKHHANLQNHELVQEATQELTRARSARTRVRAKFTETQASQTAPRTDAPAPSSSNPENSIIPCDSRESSVYEVPPPTHNTKGKGKSRRAPTPSLSPGAKRQDIASRAMLLAGRIRKSGLPDAEETSVLLEDIALGFDEEAVWGGPSSRWDDEKGLDVE